MSRRRHGQVRAELPGSRLACLPVLSVTSSALHPTLTFMPWPPLGSSHAKPATSPRSFSGYGRFVGTVVRRGSDTPEGQKQVTCGTTTVNTESTDSYTVNPHEQKMTLNDHRRGSRRFPSTMRKERARMLTSAYRFPPSF